MTKTIMTTEERAPAELSAEEEEALKYCETPCDWGRIVDAEEVLILCRIVRRLTGAAP